MDMVEIAIPVLRCLCQRRADANLLAHTGDAVTTRRHWYFSDIGPLRGGSGTPGDP